MGAMMGALIAGGSSLLGGMLNNDSARSRAHEAQDFSAEQYATRWQTTTKDMQAAGLNPMLAYTQGVGSSPQGQYAPTQDVITPAVYAATDVYRSNQQQRITNAQVGNIDADTENKKAFADLIAGQAAAAWASANQSSANVELINRTADKVTAEIKNIPTEGERLKALIRNLDAETSLVPSRKANLKSDTSLNYSTLSLNQSRRVSEILGQPGIEAVARKALAEANISSYGWDQLQKSGDFGTFTARYGPFIKMLQGLAGSGASLGSLAK